MLACGRTLLGALAAALALTAPASAYALSTGATEIRTHLDTTLAGAHLAGDRHFQRAPSPAPSHQAAKLAVESRKWASSGLAKRRTG